MSTYERATTNSRYAIDDRLLRENIAVGWMRSRRKVEELETHVRKTAGIVQDDFTPAAAVQRYKFDIVLNSNAEGHSRAENSVIFGPEVEIEIK